MRYDSGEYVLSTGRSFSANRGILGVSPLETGVVFEGYDGQVCMIDQHEIMNERTPFTKAEKREIADFMTALWDAWPA